MSIKIKGINRVGIHAKDDEAINNDISERNILISLSSNEFTGTGLKDRDFIVINARES
jgi:hypothetical protein